MVDSLITWAVRAIHVFGAVLWLGGYGVMLLVIVHHLSRERHETIRAIGLATARVLSLAGALTVVAGLALIWRTRGYGSLLGGEWGGIVITSIC